VEELTGLKEKHDKGHVVLWDYALVCQLIAAEEELAALREQRCPDCDHLWTDHNDEYGCNRDGVYAECPCAAAPPERKETQK